MKFSAILSVAVLVASVSQAADVPEVLSVLPKDQLVKAATTAIVPPKELDKYVAIVEAQAKKDPEWFKQHAEKSPPGVPLPYDPKLGLTEEQYNDYLELWSKREFKPIDPVILQLKEAGENRWSINAAMPGSDGSSPISTLRYDAEKGVFVSPNGTLERLEDVKADKDSILGEWSGAEWRFEEGTSLGKTKENFAIGKTGDEKFGLLVYRMQEVSSEGTRLYDKSLVIRFPLGKAGYLTVPTEPNR